MGLYVPELLLLVAVDVFLVLSLLTCLLEGEFPTPVPYLLQLAALAGFGQTYVSKEFLNVFSQDLRFWYSLSYLTSAVATVFLTNLYMFVVRREIAKGFLFSGSVTAPTAIFSIFFISVYVHDVEVPMTLFPRIPLSLVPLAISLSVGLLAIGIVLSTEPGVLQRLRVLKGPVTRAKVAVGDEIRAKVIGEAKRPKRRKTVPSARRRQRQRPKVPLHFLTDQEQILEEGKEVKE